MVTTGAGGDGDKVTGLADAIARHTRPGDTVHVVMGHCRWTAAARALARHYWGEPAGFTLVMLSLGSLGALFFRGGMLSRVITAYSGDSFPTYSPNPIFASSYAAGDVEVENWSFLSLVQRLEAGARGLPAVTTGSLSGSSMVENPGYSEVDSPFGHLGLLAPLRPDVALLHAPVADVEGNVATSGPALEGLWGAWGARRGAIVTVERVVEDISPWGHLTRLPAHRVLAVVQARLGAHPGGLYAPGLPAEGYGEDIPFWVDARKAARGDFDAWARRWALEPADQEAYLERLGAERVDHLLQRADPESWREDADAHPVDEGLPISSWETAAALGARELGERIASTGADAVLAGAGAANLAAWVAVGRARAEGRRVELTAELGMWGYEPTPADPYIFNQRVFPRAPLLSDASQVLGMVVGGPGTRTVACLGAAQIDMRGNINSTLIPGGPFLVGSGGGNDVASRAAECVVVTVADPRRLVPEVGFITSPGRHVVSVATDVGVLRRHDGELRLAAVAGGPGTVQDRARRAVGACGWELRVDRDVAELPPVGIGEAVALRRFDPERLFLGD